MSNSLKLRGGLVVLCLILSLFAVAPTLTGGNLPQWWLDSFGPIQRGLDLQGGIHLVLGVDVDEAVKSRVDTVIDQTETNLHEKDLIFKRVERRQGDRLVVLVYDAEEGAKVDALMKEEFPSLEAETFTGEGGYIEKHYRLSDDEIVSIKDLAVRQALETLRNRVDEFGVSEPTLQRQTGNRILIQLPGIKDPERAIDLIGKTARLEFKLVDDGANIADALAGKLEPGRELLYERDVNQLNETVSESPLVVFDKTVLTGDLLSDAQVRISNNFNQPIVSIDFNSVGAKRFDQVTAANVGKRLAIILDDRVYSAPNINERITGGSAVISGTFSTQEATDLAIVLRAGSLPAPVNILENRTVGPSLGQDSIDKGIKSIWVGALLVVITMAIYYRFSGIVAIVALGLNILFIAAMLAMFGATLTLPGLAGIVLTVGMAVDANVLIFERIREEIRLGRAPKLALDSGYSKAFWTIVDANLTTLLAALVLFQFGTGAVRGFAVTLSIGIIASLFTAMFVSRVIFDLYLQGRDIKRLSI